MFGQYAQAVKITVIGIIVLVLAGGIWWISGLRAANATLAADKSTLKTAVSAQKITIKQLQTDATDIKVINADLVEVINEQAQEIKQLDEKFNTRANGTSRDFGAITRVKPGLINKIINRATKNVNRCMELATGAPLKAGEKNNECTELVNSLK